MCADGLRSPLGLLSASRVAPGSNTHPESAHESCRAHSTAYGVEAYQAAWLKRYYPAEFMAAVLSNGKGFYRPLVYILECHRLDIPLLPACINDPGPMFA